MPVYEFDALNSGGEALTDIITADTPRDARERLRKRGLHVTRIEIVKELAKKETRSAVSGAVSAGRARSELLMVTQQFATLLKAGIPLSDALKALVDQIENRHLETVFRDLSEKVNGGSSLAQAMESHPDIFSSLYRHMVKTGEASGTLATVLARVADFSRKRNRISKKVQGALVYPLIIVGVGLVIFLFLMLFAMPNITELFKKQKLELPLITRFYMGVSDLLSNWWPVILLVSFSSGFALWRWLWHSEGGIRVRDKIFMSIPITGRLVRKSAVARFTSTFSILLEAGVPALDGLAIVRDVVGNVWLSDIVDVVRTKVMEGADIATPIKQSGLFPATVGYMIAVGEESGQLESMLKTITEAYEEEVDMEAQKLTSLLEPIMIIILAVLVSSVVISIILPLLKLTSAVKGA
ncbi:MAG: type II secretion system F family protein [Planctomycetota bacterium]